MRTLNRGDHTDPWTAARASRQAVAWQHAFADWLETDQAALMRYVPEQQQALRWWLAAGDGRRADISEVIPAWLAARYGLDVAPSAVDDSSGLSTVARMVGHVCARRAGQLRDCHPFALSPPVTSVLVSLVDTDRYRRPDPAGLASLPAAGLLVLPHPVQRTGAVAGPSLRAESSAPSPLRAIGWLRESSSAGQTLQVLDLADMTGQWGRTGDASFDNQVRAQLASAQQQLPPLMFNGETPILDQPAATQDSARAALAAAGAQRHGQNKPTWQPETVVDDSHELLAARLLSVFAAALAAPLVVTEEVLVATPGASQDQERPERTSVTVCREPA